MDAALCWVEGEARGVVLASQPRAELAAAVALQSRQAAAVLLLLAPLPQVVLPLAALRATQLWAARDLEGVIVEASRWLR